MLVIVFTVVVLLLFCAVALCSMQLQVVQCLCMPQHSMLMVEVSSRKILYSVAENMVRRCCDMPHCHADGEPVSLVDDITDGANG